MSVVSRTEGPKIHCPDTAIPTCEGHWAWAALLSARTGLGAARTGPPDCPQTLSWEGFQQGLLPDNICTQGLRTQ